MEGPYNSTNVALSISLISMVWQIGKMIIIYFKCSCSKDNNKVNPANDDNKIHPVGINSEHYIY